MLFFTTFQTDHEEQEDERKEGTRQGAHRVLRTLNKKKNKKNLSQQQMLKPMQIYESCTLPNDLHIASK